MPFFTIVMPTYNSENTISIALEALKNQNIDPVDIELLVIDGGSTDKTCEIARRYGATVIPNQKKLPEYAKALGFRHAKGRFLIKLDSDEELLRVDQLSSRKKYLESHPEIKALLANRLIPATGYGAASSYLNLFGDPFTMFCYKSKGSVRETFDFAIDNSSPQSSMLFFSKEDIKPIGDSGSTTIDLEYAKTQYPNSYSSISFACSCFENIVQDTGCCACLPDDDIRHHSGATVPQYLKKLRFRVINNLFHKEESGFARREDMNPTLKRRKYLFILYAASVFCPLLHSIYLAIRFSDASLLLHFFYVYSVCFMIAWYLAKRLFGVEATNASYGS